MASVPNEHGTVTTLTTVFLRDDGGIRIPVDARGVVIGRDPSSTIVVAHETVSRRHVLVLGTGEGAQIILLGRGSVTVNGRIVDSEGCLRHADVLEVGRSAFTLVVESPQEPTRTPWAVERNGVLYPIAKSQFTIGGSDADDLAVEGWPPGAATLFTVVGGLVLESSAGVLGAGRSAAGEAVSLRDLDAISFERVRLRVRDVSRPAGTTTSAELELATEAHLEFLPNGGILRLKWKGDHTVWLSELRANLVAALLAQTQQHADEFIQDALLFSRVWAGDPMNRIQLNTLVHRTRHTLTASGLDGPAFIERAPGGRATRIRLASGARTSVT